MAEVTVEFLGEQMRRMLDGQRRTDDSLAAIRADLDGPRGRGELLTRALDATRKGLESKIELSRVELLDAIHVDTRGEAIGARTRVEQALDALRGQIDDLARRLEAVAKA
jgi:hypothetical protein